jgi:uncharacterized protein
MNCSYCFYLEKKALYPESAVHRMNDETLDVLIKQLMTQSGRDIGITWQGGEPTLMGLDFFKKVIELELKHAGGMVKNITNSLQTNGSLLNEEWVDFLAQYNFLVGLSLDGTEIIHNANRKLGKDQPSFSRVKASLELLQHKGVAFNVLATVNSVSVDHPEEIYHYFKSLGVQWMQFIPILEKDSENPSIPTEFSVDPMKYGAFLVEIFRLWIRDFSTMPDPPSVRFIENIFHRYLGYASPECTYNRECGKYVVIEHNGDVFSCDYFVDPVHRLGNIHERRLADMLNSAQQADFGTMKSVLTPECGECQWLTYCHGGCTKDRFTSPGHDHYHFCASMKVFHSATHEAFEALAAHFKQHHAQEGTRDLSGYFK